MLLCLYIDSFFKKLTFITMFLLTVLVLGAKNLQKLPNRYRHLRLSFATYNSAWSKVSDVSEPLRNTCLACCASAAAGKGVAVLPRTSTDSSAAIVCTTVRCAVGDNDVSMSIISIINAIIKYQKKSPSKISEFSL